MGLDVTVLAALGIAAGYNLVVALVYGVDKWLAKRGARRISERTLIGLAALFGAPGAWVAMRVLRHKTRKPKFSVGVPVLLVLQAVVLAGAGVLAWPAVEAMFR